MGATVRHTYMDYRRLPDDERWQLIRGQLVREPAPAPRHQIVVAELAHAFFDACAIPAGIVGPQPGIALTAPIDVVLSDEDVFQPDLIFIAQERENIITDECILGAPDLVVEVLSPSSQYRDRGVKMQVYGAHGVREYWIVDPQHRCLEVYRNAGNSLNLYGVFRPGQKVTSPLVPALDLDPGRLFGRYT